ncbi:MAG: aspartyl/asparaginyl beta-hydroxylase domain-containing protein [Capsulimonadales bacterium]|nr:aspartyl/asparaginyl beta-hydroxylase domain-containing protein [Capsulimonadales bacterium]
MKKTTRTILKALVILVPLAYFFPWWTAFFLLCGTYDVVRNRKLDTSVVLQYFFGNGLLTWILSPFNILMDILALPYTNRGIYRLEDLPKSYQQEIRKLIDESHEIDLVGQLEERTRTQPRTMIFFKWYGANVETFVHAPAFQEKYRYIRTIGVSVFNQRESTSRHFGPLRATLRVLYNINTMEDNSAYIEVGKVKHYWCDEKLFIFDDTLLHQSFNESDKARYCLFVDILRPSPLTALLSVVVDGLRVFLRGINYLFYKNWKVLTR